MTSWGDVHSEVHDGRRTGALQVLVACLGVVLALLFAYTWHFAQALSFADERWDADRDRSYIELLGYAFVAVAAVLLLAQFVRHRAPVYAAWAAALVIVVTDDAMQLHERAGWWVERNLPVLNPPLLRPADLGEMAFWVGAGALVGAVLYAAHRRSDREAQRHSYRLAALVVLLMVFAVGVDMLHIAALAILSSHNKVDFVFISVEAAGEASAMAGLAAYAIHITRRTHRLSV